jgi:DtxR family Mn-dependent transcriptional regulator
MSTISKEDYIKAIFEIHSKFNRSVKSIELAEKLSVSKPAISDMIRKLVRDGFVEKNKYGSIMLSESGNDLALNLIRKHRLWEMFLHDVLKLSWEEIHEEAENLEHSTSDYLIEKIDDFLGNPKFDPHGSPIPDKNGNLKAIESLEKLSTKGKGKYRVKTIDDKDRSFIEALNQLKISLDTIIEVREKIDFDNSLLVKVNKREHILSQNFSEKLYVTEVF